MISATPCMSYPQGLSSSWSLCPGHTAIIQRNFYFVILPVMVFSTDSGLYTFLFSSGRSLLSQTLLLSFLYDSPCFRSAGSCPIKRSSLCPQVSLYKMHISEGTFSSWPSVPAPKVTFNMLQKFPESVCVCCMIVPIDV